MDPICIYGSEPAEGAPEWFQFTGPYLASLIPGPVADWVQFLFAVGGLPAGDQRTEAFCSVEILTAPASAQDWALVTSGQIPAAIITGAFERVIGDIKKQAWAQLCVCSAPPPPDPEHPTQWCGHVGPFAEGTSGTWETDFIPEGLDVTVWGLHFIQPTVQFTGLSLYGVGNWYSPGVANQINLNPGIYDGPPPQDVGLGLVAPPLGIIPSGAKWTGTYTAGSAPLEFELCANGNDPETPTYDPGIPELPTYDPPPLPEEGCTLEELCAITARIYIQGFSALTEILRNQGKIDAARDQLVDLQESADSILTNLLGVSTVVLDIQSKVTTLGERVELARRDANYLRRTTRYEGFSFDTLGSELTGEGQLDSAAPMIGLWAELDVIPDWAGFTGGDPKAYYHIGYVQFLSSGAWTKKFPIVSNPTVYENAPPMCSKIHYWLAPGVTATFRVRYPNPDSAAI